MFTLKQQAQLATAKGIEQIEVLEKQLREENPGAFLQNPLYQAREALSHPGGAQGVAGVAGGYLDCVVGAPLKELMIVWWERD